VHCITAKGLKLTFGIIAVIGFRGTPLWLKGDQVCDKPCYNRIYAILILLVKRDGEQFKNRDRKIEWENF
jgi:hypothetical protein